MAAPSSINSGVGFRNVQILKLDSNTNIAGTSTSTAYQGLTLSGAKALTLTDPEPRQVVHIGDDRPFALDVLPPTDPITGEINAAKTNNTLDALLQNVNEVTLGEIKLFGIGTDQRGSEAQVCMLAYRQAEDTDPDSLTYGKRVWQFRLLPICYVIPREPTWDENPESRPYTVRPQFVTKYPWGIPFASGTEGFLRGQGLRGVSEHKPKLIAFTGNGVVTSFSLPVAAYSTNKIQAWTITTLGTAAVATPTTLTTQTISYTTAPTTGALVVLYETA